MLGAVDLGAAGHFVSGILEFVSGKRGLELPHKSIIREDKTSYRFYVFPLDTSGRHCEFPGYVVQKSHGSEMSVRDPYGSFSILVAPAVLVILST